MEWIKTSEKLPEVDKAVFIVTKHPKFGWIDYDVAKPFNAYGDGRLMFEGAFAQEYELTEVLAWMPIPEYYD